MDEQLNIEVNLNGIKSLKTELREANAEYQKLLNSSAATAEQIDAAARKVGMLKEEIGDAADTAAALGSTEGKIAAIGNAAQVGVSAFQGIQAAIALTGTKSEELEATMVKLQSIMALQQSIEGLSKAGDAISNLSKVGKVAFGALKTAIGSTGIGLLVVALGMVVANFDDIKAAATNMFPALKNTGVLFDKVKQTVMGVGTAIKDYIFTPFKFLGKLIQGDIKGAIKELQSGLSIVTNYKKGAANEEIRQEKEKQDKLNETREAAEKERKAQDDKKRAEINAKAKADAAERKRKAEEKKRERKAKAKEERDEFLKLQEEKAKILTDAIEEVDRLGRTAEENELAALADKYEKLVNAEGLSEEQRTILKEEWAKKRAEIEDKYRKEEKDKVDKDNKDKYDTEKDAIDKKYAIEIEALQTKGLKKNELEQQIKQQELNALNEKLEWAKKYGQDTIELEKQIAAKKKEIADGQSKIEKEARQERIDGLNAAFEAFNQIGGAVMSLSDEVTKNKLKNVEKGSAEEQKILRKQFEDQKKMQVAMALINGAQAITAILSVPDFTLGVASAIRIAAAGVATAATVAKILSTKFDSGGGSAASKASKYEKGGLLMGRKHAEGGIMTNFGELEGGEFVVNRSATKNFLPLLEKINAGGGSGAPNNMSTMMEPMNNTPIIKTYVVASDVTSQQEVQRKINNLARL